MTASVAGQVELGGKAEELSALDLPGNSKGLRTKKSCEEPNMVSDAFASAAGRKMTAGAAILRNSSAACSPWFEGAQVNSDGAELRVVTDVAWKLVVS